METETTLVAVINLSLQSQAAVTSLDRRQRLVTESADRPTESADRLRLWIDRLRVPTDDCD